MWAECFKVGGDYTDVRPVVARAEVKAEEKTAPAPAGAERKVRSGTAARGIPMLVLGVILFDSRYPTS